jgi:ERCC4-type nuclease
MALIDIRERDLIPLLTPWPSKQLPVGDIWIGLSGEALTAGSILAERKDTNDLEASILDGRYREQRTRLVKAAQESGARPLYIIEGPMDRMWGKLSEAALQKHLNRLMLRYGIAVIHTESLQGTAALCKQLAEQIAEDSAVFKLQDAATVTYSSTVAVSKRGNKEDPHNFAATALQACPGVSSAVAEALLKELGSFSSIFSASEATLAAVKISEKRKVGPAVAKRLYGLLHFSAAVPAGPS